jgi:serine/threonine protein kinase
VIGRGTNPIDNVSPRAAHDADSAAVDGSGTLTTRPLAPTVGVPASSDQAMTGGGVADELCSTQCGSPAYAAPELLSGAKYGPKVDVWSM